MSDVKPSNEIRMNSYYYAFSPTGNRSIDLILRAVACAGKAYQYTRDWSSYASPYEYLRGDSPVEWIQNAAWDAASTIDAKDAEIALKDKAGAATTLALEVACRERDELREQVETLRRSLALVIKESDRETVAYVDAKAVLKSTKPKGEKS